MHQAGSPQAASVLAGCRLSKIVAKNLPRSDAAALALAARFFQVVTKSCEGAAYAADPVAHRLALKMRPEQRTAVKRAAMSDDTRSNAMQTISDSST